MDLYHIPNDTGSPWRQKQFLNLLKGDYIDGATDYCLLIPFAEEYHLSDNQRFYLCLIYGLCYSQTTTIRTFLQFPNLYDIKYNELNDWWVKNKNSLYFNPDKRRIKYTNQFPQSLIYFKQLFGKNPIKTLIKYIGEDYSFEKFYNFILKRWKNYGTMGAFLFFDALYGLLPYLYREPKRLDWAHRGATVQEGMAHYLYLDEQIITKKYDYPLFDMHTHNIHKKTHTPLIHIESSLCAFRKFFKQTRYAGYYADRMLDECLKNQKYCPEVPLLEYRKKTIPKKYLSELRGRNGIDKAKLSLFIDKGLLL